MQSAGFGRGGQGEDIWTPGVSSNKQRGVTSSHDDAAELAWVDPEPSVCRVHSWYWYADIHLLIAQRDRLFVEKL